MLGSTALFVLSLPLANLQDPGPVKLTAEQDHQRMMDLLHISSLRQGANGMDAKATNWQNTDETIAAKSYTKLPNPLILNNGKPVTNAKTWTNVRRKELFEDFDREVYGRMPKRTPKVTWEVAETTNSTIRDVPVVTKKLVGHVDNSAYKAIVVNIQLSLVTPANAKGKVPVIMEFGFGGNFAPRPGSTARPLPTWQQQVLSRGWGYAIIVPTSYQADNGAGLTQGIIGLVNKGQPRKVDDWGALRAWGWGVSRAIDYFETDKAVNAKEIGIEGLSRYGKASLVAMAYEPRLAIALVGSSGQGGAKLSRRYFGEMVENVAGSGEYHWMAGNYIKYAGPLTPNDLPVDSHELVALCAPRPIFVGCGSPKVEGVWVDDTGMFMGAMLAGPVYKLLGKKDIGVTEMPPMETALVDGDIAFRQHSGGHTNDPNWSTFLAFAERYLK